MVQITKREKAIRQAVDTTKVYAMAEAVQTLKAAPAAKFDESFEVALNLGVDPRHADQMVRSTVVLPHGTGKKVRVAVFAKGDLAAEAEKAGAEVVGADDLVKKVEGGFLEFDRVVAAPDCMALVGKLGKILGPKGLMPNPKLGTVTLNVAKAVQDIKSGMIEFKVEKNGIVHAGVGKKSFSEQQLSENVRAFVEAVRAAKPTGSKGVYMRKMTLTTTMGPGLKVDISTVA